MILYHTEAYNDSFNNLAHFNPMLSLRYGNTTDFQDYFWKSRLAIYEGYRAMNEAYN